MPVNNNRLTDDSDSEESIEYNADVILNRLKNIENHNDNFKVAESIMDTSKETKLQERNDNSTKNYQQDEFEKILRQSLEANNFEVELREEQSENELDDSERKFDYEKYFLQFQNSSKYVISETDSDYTDPTSEESIFDKSLDIQSSSASEVQELTQRHLYEEGIHSNADNYFHIKGDNLISDTEEIDLHANLKYKSFGDFSEGLLEEKTYHKIGTQGSIKTGDYKMELNSPNVYIRPHKSYLTPDSDAKKKLNETKRKESTDFKTYGRKGNQTVEEVGRKYKTVTKTKSDYELEALEKEMDEEVNRPDVTQLPLSGRHYTKSRSSSSLISSNSYTKAAQEYSSDPEELESMSDDNQDSSDENVRPLNEIDERIDNTREHPVQDNKYSEERGVRSALDCHGLDEALDINEERRRRELQVRLVELHEDLLRLRKELAEAKQKNQEEAEKIALLEEERLLRLKEELVPLAVIPSPDYESNWGFEQPARRMDLKRISGASEYGARLEEAEALCSDELGRLEEAMEKLEPLNRMMAFWPTSTTCSKLSQVSSSSTRRGIIMELTASIDVSSVGKKLHKTNWTNKFRAKEVVT